MEAMLEKLEVFYGDTNESRSSVYARLSVDGDASGLSLAGRITGPTCLYSRTLTSTIPLRDSGPGPTLLAEAVVPDPCFWSPELPSLYEVFVELRRDGQVIETATRQLGIRMFGRRGRNLFFNGRRWVCRGVKQRPQLMDDLSEWRETSTVMIREQPDEALCAETSRQGVFLVPILGGGQDQLLYELRQVARWASVAMVMIRADRVIDADELLSAALNVTLGQLILPREPLSLEPWANAVMSFANKPECFANQFADCHLPVLACGRYDELTTLSAARRDCDRLQADLAPYGDFAGYIIC
jgi:hypothetical protein